MVKIRLRRTGSKKKPHYRVVVADSRTPRDGRFIEIVGHYNPRTDPTTVNVHEDRVLYWLSVGAQPTDQVRKLLGNLGTLDRFTRLKEGADLEELLAEAKAAREAALSEAAAQVEKKEISPEEEKIETESSAPIEEAPAEVEEATSEEAVSSAPIEEAPAEAEEAASEEAVSSAPIIEEAPAEAEEAASEEAASEEEDQNEE